MRCIEPPDARYLSDQAEAQLTEHQRVISARSMLHDLAVTHAVDVDLVRDGESCGRGGHGPQHAAGPMPTSNSPR